MKTITAAESKAIQAEVRTAMEKVFGAHGLTLTKNRCVYSAASLRFSLECVTTDPEALAAEARLIHKWDFAAYGIDYGTIVTDGRGEKYSVSGFKRGGKLVATRVKDGKPGFYGKPEQFRLNGMPLKRDLNKVFGAEAAKTAPALNASDELPN